MQVAIDLFSSCAWPRLDELSHPLAREVSDAIDAGDDCDYCALATYGAEARIHHNVLTRVVFEKGGTVGGYVVTRSTNASGVAERRIAQRAGHFATQESTYTGHFAQQHVRLLPLRSAHHAPLRSLKQLLFRLEHLTTIAELDGLRQLIPSRPEWLPSGQPAVPIDLLSAAFTSKSANVFASETRNPPVKPGRRTPDSRLPCMVGALPLTTD